VAGSGGPQKNILTFAGSDAESPLHFGAAEYDPIVISRIDEFERQARDAVIDPAAWPSVMEGMSRAVRAEGAVLLQSDVRTPDVPRTPAISDAIDAYFRDGWQRRDVRAEGACLSYTVASRL
jgi:hypothetical protein